MKRLSILTFILVVMLGLVSCGSDDASSSNSTANSYFNNQWTGTDPLFGQNQYYDLEQKYAVLKNAVQAKSITEGLREFDFFEHEEGTYSTTYFNYGTISMRKKAVDETPVNGALSVDYTEFTGSPIIDPNTASSEVFDATDKQAIVDEVFSRSHTKVLQSIQTVQLSINGRNYPAYKVVYMERSTSGYFYTNKVSSYVVCLAIPLMANPILVEEMVAGGSYKLLRAAQFNQN